MSDKAIKAEWEKQAGRRYDGVLQKARSKKIQPSWIDSPTWDAWMAFWSTPEYQAKSAKQKANRLSRPALHTGGSITHRRHRERMEADLGHKVGPYDVFLRTHTQHGDPTQFVDDRSAELNARIQSSLSERSSEGSTSLQDQCDAYMEAVGGVGPGGSVFGLGSDASHFFAEQIRNPRRDGTRVNEISRENEHLRNRVDVLERQRQESDRQVAEILSRQQENDRRQQESDRRYAEMQRMMELHFSRGRFDADGSGPHEPPPPPT